MAQELIGSIKLGFYIGINYQTITVANTANISMD